MFTALFLIAKKQKKPKCLSMDEWIYNMFIYIFIMKYYSCIKRKEIIQLATTWINLKGTILSEVNQREKDTYNMV